MLNEKNICLTFRAISFGVLPLCGSLMVFEYSELKAAYFTPAPEDMLNDAFLGFSIIALGLIVWIIILLIKDPNSVIRDALFSKKNK